MALISLVPMRVTKNKAGQCAALSSFRVGKLYFSGKRVCFHESAKNAVIGVGGGGGGGGGWAK